MIYTEERDYWKAGGFHKHIKLLRITFDTYWTQLSAVTYSKLYIKRAASGKSEHKINGFLTIFLKAFLDLLK